MIRTGSDGFAREVTTSAVMIFVRLAIGSDVSGLHLNSTSPDETSNTSAARGGLRMRMWKESTPVIGTSGTGWSRTRGDGSRDSPGDFCAGCAAEASGKGSRSEPRAGLSRGVSAR